MLMVKLSNINISNNENNVIVERNNTTVIKDDKLIAIDDEENINEEGMIYEYMSSEENSNEISVRVAYIVNGKNKGNLQIAKNNEIVYTKKISKEIVDIQKLEDRYDSDIFVLYDDGTVGKITISDIANNKFDIIEVENCKNIIRIQELMFEYESAGADYVLVAVNEEGKIYTLMAGSQ